MLQRHQLLWPPGSWSSITCEGNAIIIKCIFSPTQVDPHPTCCIHGFIRWAKSKMKEFYISNGVLDWQWHILFSAVSPLLLIQKLFNNLSHSCPIVASSGFRGIIFGRLPIKLISRVGSQHPCERRESWVKERQSQEWRKRSKRGRLERRGGSSEFKGGAYKRFQSQVKAVCTVYTPPFFVCWKCTTATAIHKCSTLHFTYLSYIHSIYTENYSFT